MSDRDLTNAFEPGFLNVLEKKGLPPVTLTEAAYVGPWKVVRQGNEWAVKREADMTPWVVTEFRETACMIAAVLPAVGRPPIYGLDAKALRTSFGERGFSRIGQFEESSDEELLRPLHVAHCLLVDPESLAWLLMAAPPETLKRVGQIVAERTNGGTGDETRKEQ